MKLPSLTSCVGYEADGKGNFSFQFKSADGRSHYVPIKTSALNALAPMMLNILQNPNDEMEAQPAVLTAARGAYLADGSPLLVLGLDNIQVVVDVSRSGGVPKLQAILADFQSRQNESNARH